MGPDGARLLCPTAADRENSPYPDYELQPISGQGHDHDSTSTLSGGVDLTGPTVEEHVLKSLFDIMSWMNEPPFHTIENGTLTVRSGSKTDFWQGTYYGFHRDNGHFMWVPRAGEFMASVAFRGRYDGLYDQAGMMIRADSTHWIKCGVEFTDGHQHISVVVTNGQSDWSAFRLTGNPDTVSIKMTRLNDAVFVQYSLDGNEWLMARLAYFPPEIRDLKVGVTFCSPEREGFEASFSQFEIGDPVSRDIH